jgi:hypothetical protein
MRVLLVAVAAIAAARFASAQFVDCPDVVAIPSNADGVTNASCSACNNGAQTWYPCTRPDLCYCGTGTVPPQYAPPFLYCPNVIAIPGNPDNRNNTDCAVCNSGGNRHYPCDRADLCYCSGDTVPPQYRLPFFTCSKAVVAPNVTHNLTDAQCGVCSNGTYAHYPCNPAGTYCTCAAGHGYVETTTAPPTSTTVAPTTTKASTNWEEAL